MRNRYISNISIIIFGIMCVFVFQSTVLSINCQDVQKIKIGVLAHNGVKKCQQQWKPTIEYLNSNLSEFEFELVPVNFNNIQELVKNGEFDFILCNSALYISLEVHSNISRILTLINGRNKEAATHFGGVIFCQSKNKEIYSIKDLKNKSFMATDSTSFGGWLCCLYELKNNNIDPIDDFTNLSFSDKHDSVVHAVIDGKVDAGTCRTGIIEKMHKDGLINKNQLRILNQNVNYAKENDFNLLLSTKLYPEWPLAKLHHVPDKIAKKVAAVLLNMEENDSAAIGGGYSGWTVPKNYQVVANCLRELKVDPFENYGKITIKDALNQHIYLFLSGVLFILLAVVFIIVLARLYNRLRIANLLNTETLSQKNELLEALSNSEKSLIELNASKDKFFSIIAHDIKSPFNGFLGLTKIMAEEIDVLSIDRIKEFSIAMQRSANNLYKLLENLLEWSRIQRGKVEFNPEYCNIFSLVRYNIDILQPKLLQKELSIENKIDKDLYINVDQQMLNTIFRNLLSNAVKFTHRGGNIEIGNKSNHADNNHVFYVKDIGIGIPADKITKLFEIDQKVSRLGTEGEPSTGLGLLLCKEYIEKHNGKIWIESEEGKGTTFNFSIIPTI